MRENARWIGGGFALTYASSFGQTFFISASAAEWQAQFGLSHGAFGLLYMVATMASAACLPFIGRMVDVVAEHRMALYCTLALAGAALLAGWAPTVWVLLVAVFLLRLFGQGMMMHIAMTATGRWFAARRGRAVSYVAMGLHGGEASLPLAFAVIAGALGIAAGWTAAAALMALVITPLSVWAYSRPRTPQGVALEHDHGEAGRSWTRAEVLRDPWFWVLLTGVLAPPFIVTTLLFHQDYLTTLRGWAPNAFAQSFVLMATTTVITALINGALIDRYGAKSVLPYFLGPLTGACLIAAFGEAQWTLFAFMALLGVSNGVASTLFGAIWPEIYGPKHLGAVRSLITAIMVLSTAAGPGITGALIDAGVGLPVQLASLAGYCVVVSTALAAASSTLRRRARLGV